ncbi:MAG: TolC family protein [Acidobacteriaceae bacterium]|nr:TolC family protein [Acidobacteriaceae bacterium]
MTSRINSALGLSLLLCAGRFVAAAQEPLTLRQAVDQALGQSPQTAISRADDQKFAATATLARTQLLPRLNFTEEISRGDDPVYAFGTRLRERQFTQNDFALNALNRPQPIGNFATRFSGSWTAFDSFKTQREIHRSDLLRTSASSSAKAVDQQIVLHVIEAYQSALYAQREIDVAQHEQETAAALLASTEDHVKAGLAVESDRMSAEVNVAARKEELIAAQGDLDLAWAELREAMGAPNLKATELKPIEPHTFTQLALDEEIATATKMRPDLTALSQTQSAQAVAVGAARSAFGPSVNAYGNWEEDRGSLDNSGGHNWVAGVQISIDILPVGKRAQLAQESAAKQRMDAQISASQQQVRLQVSRAHIHRQTAELTFVTARAAMDQSAESLRILKNRYAAGLATITDLLRAEDAERQSQAMYWKAVYNNAVAYAELLYATGTLTPEAAEDLQ